MTQDAPNLVEEGRAALARHDWPAAYRLLSRGTPPT